ncbi:MAG TPA: PKD domain-containing protein [Candidatus Acidoferrum sp.]|nr:PKD domain-containing protein [Candidatus Acidoferrum sp.]
MVPSHWGRIVAFVSLGLALMCATAGAQVYSAPKNVSNNSDYSLTPQVAVDAAGNIYVVWEDDIPNTSNSNIVFSRSTDGGASFSTPPKNLSKGSGFRFDPRIAVDTSGAINVVWVDDTPGNWDIFFSRSTDGGASFSAPQNLSAPQNPDPPDSANPQIAVDAGGNISVVWENLNITYGIFFSHSSDGGATFSTPVNLATNTSGSFSPQLAVGVNGSINVVWEDDIALPSGVLQSHISFSHSTDNFATRSDPKNLSNNSGNSPGPQIAVDPSGNIDVAWMDSSAGNYQILFSRSADQGATFSGAKNLSNSLYDSTNPQIRVDTNGGVYVAWQEIVPPAFNGDIFLARSSDGGANFFDPANLSNNTGDSSNPWITVDATGGIDLNWLDTTPGRANIFFASSMDAFATHNVSNDSGSSSNGHVAADKNGNLNVVWSDDASGVNQILFSRFSSPQVTNHPPVANAGPEQTVECTGHGCALVTLDGSKSSDPDGDTLSFVWRDESKNLVGASAVVQFTAPLGAHSYTLTVTDSGGLTDMAATHVIVRDTNPPTLRVSLSPNVLRPREHKLVRVTATIDARDTCDANPAVKLVSIASNDPDDRGRRGRRSDVQAVGGGPIPFGTDVRSFLLRAEDSEHGRDVVYTITYSATDASGNATSATAQVRVAHHASDESRRRSRDKDDEKNSTRSDH